MTERSRKRIGFLSASVLVLLACGKGEPEVTPEEEQRVVAVGELAAGELLRALIGSLTKALEEDGIGAALELCSNEAIPLTRMVEAGLEHPLSLKRTSLRYRNPENAPDEGEEVALHFFERAIQEEGQAPGSYVQKVSESEYRYYQPLYLGEVCLRCHGALQSMGPDVLRILSERYPQDLATGYQTGDFRGLVRVSVPSEVLESGGT
jgi:hypothetical protein